MVECAVLTTAESLMWLKKGVVMMEIKSSYSLEMVFNCINRARNLRGRRCNNCVFV